MTKLQKRSQKTLFLCLLYIALQAGMEKKAMAENTNDDPDRKFRAAVVKTDITPDGPQTLLGYAPRTSTSIHDRIYHRILLLDDGDTEFVLVSTEVCEFSPEIYDQVAAQLKKKTGIAPDHFLWTVTHTHSAPEFGPAGLAEVFLGERYTHEYDKDYMNFVIDKLLEGIIQARKALEPARLGTGWGHAQANINRRARDTDGTTTLGLNPDGPVDRRIGLIRIDKANGSPMVLLANYAIHGTVLGGSSTVISGDAPGVVAAYVEEKLGAPMMFINGASGNLAPIYSVYPDPRSGHLSQFRVLLGDKILEANKKISTSHEVGLQVGALTVETPAKEKLDWTPGLKRYARQSASGPDKVLLPIGFLKINDDIAIWSAPVELFCEISNEVRERSPFAYTFYFGFSNGWLGYLLTAEEWQYGGYETEVSPYTPAAAEDLKSAVLGYLQGELRGEQGR